MKNILGIGKAGCHVVGLLSERKEYNPYAITNSDSNIKQNFALPTLSSPEDYEGLDIDELVSFLGPIRDNVSIFLCGASICTGMSLRVMEALYKKGVRIEVIYFKPEIEVLSETKRLQERVCRNVLQQYARSGLFRKITLVSNEVLESLAGPTSVIDYYKRINTVFTNSYYMIDVLKNTKPITSTFSNLHESCRISTMGVGSVAEDEAMFYPLKQEVDVRYYFGINEEKLKTEENLLRTITDKIKSRITDETKVSFAIYPTKYEQDYIYVEYFSPKVQESA